VFVVTVLAGFPSPAEDFVEGPLDLNQHLISQPAATFFVRVKGDSMIGAGICSGDLLIVDRSVNAGHGDIVIAVLEGDLTVKRLHYVTWGVRLVPENPNYPSIHIPDTANFQVWGVVTRAIHYLR